MSSEKKYSLLEEPWIAVMNLQGDLKEVSLTELYQNAHTYVSLAGETETQNAAVLRFLLAPLHAFLGRYRIHAHDGQYIQSFQDRVFWDRPKGDDLLEQWSVIWKARELPWELIADYLNVFRDHFYLFHPVHPFMQIPKEVNRGDSKGPYKPSKMIGDILKSDNKHRPFLTRNADCADKIPYSEAARWLLHTNAYADSSNKPPRNSGLPSAGVGWLGQLSLIYAVGETLFETLMLNLKLLQDDASPWEDESPIWEIRETKGVDASERQEITPPENLASLYTHTSRHLTLLDDGEAVNGYLLISGSFFPQENMFTEPMTLWRYSKDAKAYAPKTFQPDKHLWREFSALADIRETSPTATKGAAKVPGIVKWLSILSDRGMIGAPLLTLRSVGAVYDSKKCSIEDVSSDGLCFSVALLAKAGAIWDEHIQVAIEKTDQMADASKQLQYGLLKAVGIGITDNSGPAQKSQPGAIVSKESSRLYHLFDEPFRAWLRSIDPGSTDYEAKTRDWLTEAKRITEQHAQNLVAQAGQEALLGRKDKKKWHTSATAFNVYRNRMNRIIKEVSHELSASAPTG